MQPHADHPPLDPPPFGQASARLCIRQQVFIQNHHDRGRPEVLILTSLTKSVDELLRGDGASNGDDMSIDRDDVSDVSDSSSSSEEYSSEDGDAEGVGVGSADLERRPVPRIKAFWLNRTPMREVGYHYIHSSWKCLASLKRSRLFCIGVCIDR